MIYSKNISTPIGSLAIVAEEDFITKIFFGKCEITRENDLVNAAEEQILEYFDGKRKSFDLPVKPEGTDFQKRVWAELAKIRYGETVSYKELAEKAGNGNACRAVGGAMNKNPLLIVYPCHRVIGKNGSLTGFGCGLKIKEQLLCMEKNNPEKA